MRIFRVLAALAAASAVNGCSSDTAGPAASPTAPPAPSSPGATTGAIQFAGRSSVETLARVVAVTMQDAAVRASVRDAMRASPLTEHKLSFRTFAGSPAGARLLMAASHAASVAPTAFLTALSGFPDLDFYMPAREHRRAWRATADVSVGVSLDGTPSPIAYLVSGETVAIDLLHGLPEHPLIMLQSAEFAARRVHRQAAALGDRIEDEDDGAMGGVWIRMDANGHRTETQLADLVGRPGAGLQDCFPTEENNYCSGGGGGGGGGVVDHPTSVTTFATDGVCDNGNCFETNEFELSTSTQFGGNSGFLRETGIGSTVELHPNWTLISTNPFYSGTMFVTVRETDATSGDDNWAYLLPQGGFGAIPVTSSDNGGLWPLYEAPCCVDPFVNSPGVFTAFGW